MIVYLHLFIFYEKLSYVSSKCCKTSKTEYKYHKSIHMKGHLSSGDLFPRVSSSAFCDTQFYHKVCTSGHAGTHFPSEEEFFHRM